MKVLGFSVPLFVVILAVAVLSAKYPGWLGKVPVLNRL